jgi:hypothetical protein
MRLRSLESLDLGYEESSQAMRQHQRCTVVASYSDDHGELNKKRPGPGTSEAPLVMRH